MENEREEATALCRDAADKMASMDDQTVLFPSWDLAHVPKNELSEIEAIRRAAVAILGKTDDSDGVYVPLSNVARLLHYIGDMLEE